jgi:Arc/MetJ-type ribon-helix-helix transcriptional regulator
VQNRVFKNRSQAINEALKEKLSKIKKTRLEKECKKLSPQEEIEWVELGLEEDLKEWSQY